ncbi:MAG: type II toxin-antitoxin system prevent-host-death family antitoxin [Chloroflexota bacterium]|nr:type II toxin-antitoxin system prevent-host-death family antitoxin [Chloroflexota bacterium]MDE2839566.1 type II toxin-antitoxin system prevent-host-death family antitoxin [Chloroflexota bacterium]MDE2929496.1 type II toxin-antitoxin system prevent-host-death family antitoxin [Chloroflexota bacterium]
MKKIQTTEAKARLADLLRMVERGETVAITRHGKTIAHLVPAHVQESDSRKLAVERFRQRRAGWRRVAMTTAEILAARHEGHRS